MSSPTSIPPRPGSAAAKKQRQQANRPAPEFRKRGAHRPQRRSLVNAWTIGGALALVVLVIGVVSILSATESPADRGEFAQTRDVTVTGDALPMFVDDGVDPAVGLAAPVLAGQNFEGIGVEVGPGAPTLVVFVAHWCPVCQREVPELVEWNRQGQVPAGLRVVGVSTGTDARRENYPPSDWLVREGFPWALVADSDEGAAAQAFGVSAYPFFVLLDADGTVAWRGSGAYPSADLTAIVQRSLGS